MNLIIFAGVRKRFIVIDLDDKGYSMGVPPGDGTQSSQSRCHSVAVAFNRQFEDIFRVKIDGIRCERCPRRVFDTLIHRQNRQITRACQSSMTQKGLQTAQHARGPVGNSKNPVYPVRPGQMQQFFRNFGLMLQKRFGFRPQYLLYLIES